MMTRHKTFIRMLTLLATGALFSATAAQAAPDLSERGKASICSYDDGLYEWGYNSARVFHPCDLKDERPAVTLTGGYTNTKEQVYWLAKHLSSHGYIVIAITPYNIFGTPPVWESAHKAGLEELKEENGIWYKPLYGHVDTDRMGVMGYSMGGGGALLAAADLGNRIDAALGLAPYVGDEKPWYPGIEASTLMIGGSQDLIVSDDAVAASYANLPTDISRGLAILRGMNHLNWVDFSSTEKDRARVLVTAWLKRSLDGEDKYQRWFDGRVHDDHVAEHWFTQYDFHE